jgi:hypothetical protein
MEIGLATHRSTDAPGVNALHDSLAFSEILGSGYMPRRGLPSPHSCRRSLPAVRSQTPLRMGEAPMGPRVRTPPLASIPHRDRMPIRVRTLPRESTRPLGQTPRARTRRSLELMRRTRRPGTMPRMTRAAAETPKRRTRARPRWASILPWGGAAGAFSDRTPRNL